MISNDNGEGSSDIVLRCTTFMCVENRHMCLTNMLFKLKSTNIFCRHHSR